MAIAYKCDRCGECKPGLAPFRIRRLKNVGRGADNFASLDEFDLCVDCNEFIERFLKTKNKPIREESKNED